MPLIPFPDVPQVPGVPAVFRDLTIPTRAQLVNIALGGLAELVFGTPPWGVYDQDGRKVLIPDSFLGIRFGQGARVPNFPMEAGSFAAYNKVQVPYDASVRMALGGDQASREAFLAQVEAMVKSTDLFQVITPDASYTQANMVNYHYSRQQRNGAAMIVVDLMFTEIRQTAAALFSQVQSPSGADPVNDGQVQAFPVADQGPLNNRPEGTIQ